MKKFTTLRTIGDIFQILGYINIIALIIFLLVMGLGIDNGNSLFFGSKILSIILSALIGIIPVIIFFAFSEIIYLFLQIEINSRSSKIEELLMILNESLKGNSQNEIKFQEQFQHWKMQNPGKSINDYYNALGR